MRAVKTYAPYGLVTLGMITKVAPHPYNITATNSSLVYGPTAIKNLWASIYPLLMVFITELIYSGLIMQYPITFIFPFVSNFISYILTAALTKYLTHFDKEINYVKSGSLVLFSSVQFFLSSNLVAYLSNPEFYSSLAECYILGLPFFGYELLGNVVYSIILFGADFAIRKYIADEIETSTNYSQVQDEKLHSIIAQSDSA